VQEETRSTKKLKHLLVLISRLLALACLIVAFAQPYIPATKTATKSGRSVISIYIDNSFSMTAKGTEGELLSEARETARRMIENAARNTLFLLHTNMMNGIEQRVVSSPDALERLDKIEPSPITRRLDDVLKWQRAALKKESETTQRIGSTQHILLSDFQRKDLNDFNCEKDDHSFYYPILLSPQNKQNLSVDSVYFSSPVHKKGMNNELHIRLKNHGDRAITNADVHAEIGNIKRDVFVDVAANSYVETVVNYTEPSSGQKQGKISLNDKQLFWDDAYYFSYTVIDHSNVLVINAENAQAPVERVFKLEPFYKLKTIREYEFSADLLNGTDLVVLNGLNDPSSGFTDEIVSFCKLGGTVAIFPGPESQVSSWNVLLSEIGLPLLGTKISSGTRIKTLNYEDPFFDGMFEKKKSDLRMPSVNTLYRCTAGNKSDYLPLIVTENGQPLFLRSGGDLNAFLMCSSLESKHGNFTSNALFPSILLRVGEMSQRKSPVSLTIGGEAFFPIYKTLKNDRPLKIKGNKIEFVPQLLSSGFTSTLSLTGQEAIETLIAGNYNVMDEEINVAPLSLNYDRLESSTDYCSTSEIEDIMENTGLKNVSSQEIKEGQSVTKIDIEKPFEYWKWFISLTLVFLFTELALLKFLK
jgi:hypothetical protein